MDTFINSFIVGFILFMVFAAIRKDKISPDLEFIWHIS